MADIFDLTDAWNDAGTTFTSIKMDVTDTASAADSKLIDLQVGGTSMFSVRKDGLARLNGTLMKKSVGSISAAGTTQGTATPITADIVRITDGTGGVIMPPAKAGMQVTIINNTNSAVMVYPASGENFAGVTNIATNAAGYMTAGATATISCAADGIWSCPGLWQGHPVNGVFGIGGMVRTGTGAADSTTTLVDPKGISLMAVTDSVLGLGGAGAWHQGNLLTNSAVGGEGGYYIRMDGNLSACILSTNAGRDLRFKNNPDGTFRMTARLSAVNGQVNYHEVTGGATGDPIVLGAAGSDADIDIRLAPKGDGLVSFGAHAAIGGETVTGCIEIKDAAGNVRKLAVVS